MKSFRVYVNHEVVANISADTLDQASEIAGKAYPDMTVRVEKL